MRRIKIKYAIWVLSLRYVSDSFNTTLTRAFQYVDQYADFKACARNFAPLYGVAMLHALRRTPGPQECGLIREIRRAREVILENKRQSGHTQRAAEDRWYLDEELFWKIACLTTTMSAGTKFGPHLESWDIADGSYLQIATDIVCYMGDISTLCPPFEPTRREEWPLYGSAVLLAARMGRLEALECCSSRTSPHRMATGMECAMLRFFQEICASLSSASRDIPIKILITEWGIRRWVLRLRWAKSRSCNDFWMIGTLKLAFQTSS
ncbi:hypothetical protein BDV19DRAFT_244231 [Aspergillus venezuelensis]